MMRILVMAMLGLLAALMAQAGDGPVITQMSGATLEQRLDGDTAPYILDVRTPEEYAEGHIPGAVNIPHTELEDRLNELPADRNTEIVVHCQSGRRAGTAEDILIANGFTQVRDLDGHWAEWTETGRPQEGADE